MIFVERSEYKYDRKITSPGDPSHWPEEWLGVVQVEQIGTAERGERGRRRQCREIAIRRSEREVSRLVTSRRCWLEPSTRKAGAGAK